MKRTTMPIQVGTDLDLRSRRGECVVIVRSIPWELIGDEAAERQCQRNHGGQSLETIAKRAGFSACEAVCVIAGIPWRELGSEEDAHRILYAMRVLFNRGKLMAKEEAA